jgi:hypothetical protein
MDNLSAPGVGMSADAARMSASHECVRHIITNECL